MQHSCAHSLHGDWPPGEHDRSNLAQMKKCKDPSLASSFDTHELVGNESPSINRPLANTLLFVVE